MRASELLRKLLLAVQGKPKVRVRPGKNLPREVEPTPAPIAASGSQLSSPEMSYSAVPADQLTHLYPWEKERKNEQ